MSKHAGNGHKSTPNGRRTVRHSKDDALDRREYELLLEGCYRLDGYYALQCQFVVLVAGRLGMRAGEIAHMTEDWVDFRRRMVVIPRHEPCTDGRDGGPCAYCRKNAQQRADHDEDVTYEDALSRMWQSKTDAAAREIPFDSHPKVEIIIERFFERFDAWPASRQSINRRVDKAARHADELDEEDVYPHCLRATAATRLAARGIDIFSLQSMLGWATLSTAHRYVSSSGERTAQALRDI